MGLVALGAYRSIPAWAGEPPSRPWREVRPTVYPRVGGGTSRVVGVGVAGVGLSPRGRGNQHRQLGFRHHLRSIPAWAGEPPGRLPSPASTQVYPRVGGGTATTHLEGQEGYGLSPRGRGNQVAERLKLVDDRSIPAWAGEPMTCAARPTPTPVYPRVGGGTGLGGLSAIAALRSIPAWAGEPAALTAPIPPKWVYPRVGGGTFEGYDVTTTIDGSIPAWAGEPPARPTISCCGRVYPRVGGGTFEGYDVTTTIDGSIPAWAGEPPARPTISCCGRVYPRVGGGTFVA